MSEELRDVLKAISSNLTNLEYAALVTAEMLGEARHQEFQARRSVVVAKAAQAGATATVKKTLQDSGAIDGRNADTRKLQLETALANDPTLSAHEASVERAEHEYGGATIAVQYHQDLFKVLIEAVRREKNERTG